MGQSIPRLDSKCYGMLKDSEQKKKKKKRKKKHTKIQNEIIYINLTFLGSMERVPPINPVNFFSFSSFRITASHQPTNFDNFTQSI
jgi:hypothetical protein